MVAVKVSSLRDLVYSANWGSAKSKTMGIPRHSKNDPLKEAAALQFLGSYHPHVLGCLDVLRDRKNLYIVMPWCKGGDLYDQFIGRGSKGHGSSRPKALSEDQARVLFRQLLSGISHLQKKGVCHRSLSLENLVVDSTGQLKIIDFGMALRVPFTDIKNFNSISDVSEGSIRRLISRDHHQRGGNLTYLAPEILEGSDFDGFAVDLWAAGIILFCWLVRATPFRVAHPSDLRFARISAGHLKEMVRGLEISMSDDACDLLQHMLHGDAMKRLCLSQIQDHPWLKAGAASPCIVQKASAFSCHNTATTADFLVSLELPPQHSPAQTLTTT
jgi:serine/threonine protein kinase